MTVTIPLTQGQAAVIDDADAALIARYHWWAAKRPHTYYAVTKIKVTPGRRGRRRILHMHQLIMGDPPGMQVDHVNRDGLDNRRANLRVATQSQNKANSGRYRNNASGFKGVYWRRSHQQWEAQITHQGRRYHLGYFRSPEDAARAYDAKARQLHGAFASCNFPEP